MTAIGRRVAIVAASAIACVAGPPNAGAGEVSLVGSELRFTAAPGETNRLHVTDFAGGEYSFGDETAPLAAGPGCRPADPAGRGARCDGARAAAARIDVGDGDDSVFGFYTSLPLVIAGGPGADQIAGGKAANAIAGGDGDDALAAAPSPEPIGNTFDGGPGNDTISALQEKILRPGRKTEVIGFKATRDRVACGDGTDRVSAADLLDDFARDCESVTRFVGANEILLLGTPATT